MTVVIREDVDENHGHKQSIKQLKGMVPQPEPPVSLEEMDDAIQIDNSTLILVCKTVSLNCLAGKPQTCGMMRALPKLFLPHLFPMLIMRSTATTIAGLALVGLFSAYSEPQPAGTIIMPASAAFIPPTQDARNIYYPLREVTCIALKQEKKLELWAGVRGEFRFINVSSKMF